MVVYYEGHIDIAVLIAIKIESILNAIGLQFLTYHHSHMHIQMSVEIKHILCKWSMDLFLY